MMRIRMKFDCLDNIYCEACVAVDQGGFLYMKTKRYCSLGIQMCMSRPRPHAEHGDEQAPNSARELWRDVRIGR